MCVDLRVIEAAHSGRQLDEIHDISHAGHPADALPANAFGEGGRRTSADGRDPVVGANFGERQSGDLAGLHEFQNPVFDAFVGHDWLPVNYASEISSVGGEPM